MKTKVLKLQSQGRESATPLHQPDMQAVWENRQKEQSVTINFQVSALRTRGQCRPQWH